jgi:hypothetical protein
MRDPKRIPKVLKEIEKIWKKHPDLRLGQLIGNHIEGLLVYYVEDENLIQILKEGYA